MKHQAPGKSGREGITLVELCDMFPTEESAREWIEARVWPDGRYCPQCGSTRTHEAGHNHMPYRCSDCRSYFSVKTATVMRKSHIPLRKWVFAIYLHLTSLKGVSSMKLHRDIGVSQPAAWFMLQRIRKAWGSDASLFAGPIEIDETYMGGRDRNKHANKKPRVGRGPVSKTAVVGAKAARPSRWTEFNDSLSQATACYIREAGDLLMTTRAWRVGRILRHREALRVSLAVDATAQGRVRRAGGSHPSPPPDDGHHQEDAEASPPAVAVLSVVPGEERPPQGAQGWR